LNFLPDMGVEVERRNWNKENLRGGLYGLLVGDALGVPYEFHLSAEIPDYEKIEMTPPLGFVRAHGSVAPGTWSDDGAQALCLLDSLVSCGRFCLEDFSDKLLEWYQNGRWAVEGNVFDVGIQTGEALCAYAAGKSPEECGMLRPNGKGNGALMRTLPLALWHRGSDEELVTDAHSQCLITHGNRSNQVCCALYCMTARYLLSGMDFTQASCHGVKTLRELYRKMPEYEQELEWGVRPEEPWEGQGSGYVVDCLRSAFMIMGRASGYEDAVKQAVLLGDDTDTTACVTGGLAGILYGFGDIPVRWYQALRAREDVEALLQAAERS
jgi:ADP-ribosylglycohydrolase